MPELARLLPQPGPLWGHYPLRGPQTMAPAGRPLAGWWAASRCRRIAQAASEHARHWASLSEPARQAGLQQLRRTLRQQGLCAPAIAQALGLAACYAEQRLGWAARPGQYMAAAALLDNHMAEMDTGEGKTLALALAAAVAGLAGIPVHVVTANEYLAGRDAAALSGWFAVLGLRATALPSDADTADENSRRAAYAHDIVYATAKALAFDSLRDRQAAAGQGEWERVAAKLAGGAPEPRLMRGLCMALLDEADSILLDEAELPLILSRQVPHAARRAFLWQALVLARQMQAGQDFELQALERSATLTAQGEALLAQLSAGLGGVWQRPRFRREALQIALAALHVFKRNEHYLVRAGSIELLDEVSGRVAPGRVWSRGLHSLVAMKEGLTPAPEVQTLAQTTFQRFFQRYWRLGGISGTLWEARAELERVYGSAVLRIPSHQPCRRQQLPPRSFDTAEALFEAAAQRVESFRACGRPVLIGTDNVADSQLMSACLERRGIAHQVLNALNDAEEAAIIARAGLAGQVTVATRMAGRGTDILLDAAARAAGGLHVLSCQHNRARRQDRQLAGRAARHGEPGSAEIWQKCAFSEHDSLGISRKLKRCPHLQIIFSPPCLINARRRWFQWRAERLRAAARYTLLEQDRHWEDRLSFAGPQD